MLKPYSPDDLKWHVEEDTNLLELIKREPKLYLKVSKLIGRAKRVVKRSGLNPEELTVEHILKLLKKERPDLYPQASTMAGRLWLERNLRIFKEEFGW